MSDLDQAIRSAVASAQDALAESARAFGVALASLADRETAIEGRLAALEELAATLSSSAIELREAVQSVDRNLTELLAKLDDGEEPEEEEDPSGGEESEGEGEDGEEIPEGPAFVVEGETFVGLRSGHLVVPKLERVGPSETVRGSFWTPDSSGAMGIGILADESSPGYLVSARIGGGAFQLTGPNGRTLAGDLWTGKKLEPGVELAYRIGWERVNGIPGGVTIRAKLWTEGNDEPPEWQILARDTAPGFRAEGGFAIWCED